MPYCHKCGTKLDETARFCPVCGTPVATATSEIKPTAPKRKPFYVLPVVILIAVLISALVIGALLFLPLYPVHFNQKNQVPEADMADLFVNFQVDVAQMNIFFKNLPGNMVELNVTADGTVGIFDDPNRAVNVTFSYQTTNSSVVVIASVFQTIRWSMLHNVNVKCDLYIDPSANVTIEVRSSVGNIVMDADTDVIPQNIDFETTTGNVDASLSKNTVVAGSVSLKTITGSMQFKMRKADVSGNTSVNLRSTTGAVNVDLAATQLSGNVTVNARTTTGSINLNMAIENDVGARIESDTDLGRIALEAKRFSGNQSPIQSNNYPAGGNFLVNLRTTTGGININSTYGSSAVLN
ncbi:MAG: zinc-ribbon domain-containing protein [Candidatus Bathyarchaeota archaeon]|nr:zinc-ribbon domain-containing protein [Candidatus Bathyarchaeota archaeon]